MITPAEINAMNVAIASFRARLDEAKKAVGWGIGDWFFDLFYIGGSPRADVRDAVLGGEKLYSALIAKRNEVINNGDAIDVHEQVLSIVEIARRAAKWDRADSVNQYREATNVGGKTAESIGGLLTPEAIKSYLFWLKVIIGAALATLAIYIYSLLPKRK